MPHSSTVIPADVRAGLLLDEVSLAVELVVALPLALIPPPVVESMVAFR